jgi:hypothetical protein
MEYGSLREKIAAGKIERKAKYASFAAAFAEARAAGLAAGNAKRPVPMIVTQHENALDDNSAVKQQWFVEGGACGFAWVKVRNGNSSFAKWLMKNKLARKSYYGGVEISVHEHEQSIERKEAHASAMAKVLVEKLGVEAYADSRMD